MWQRAAHDTVYQVRSTGYILCNIYIYIQLYTYAGCTSYKIRSTYVDITKYSNMSSSIIHTSYIRFLYFFVRACKSKILVPHTHTYDTAIGTVQITLKIKKNTRTAVVLRYYPKQASSVCLCVLASHQFVLDASLHLRHRYFTIFDNMGASEDQRPGLVTPGVKYNHTPRSVFLSYTSFGYHIQQRETFLYTGWLISYKQHHGLFWVLWSTFWSNQC